VRSENHKYKEVSLKKGGYIGRIDKKYFLQRRGNLQVVYNACIKIFSQDRDLVLSGDVYTAGSRLKYRIRSVCYKPSF
jgi:hypothetical protein